MLEATLVISQRSSNEAIIKGRGKKTWQKDAAQERMRPRLASKPRSTKTKDFGRGVNNGRNLGKHPWSSMLRRCVERC